MRIIELHAENVKRLKAVDITPPENVVVISGKNAQGKTSVLDAIWLALAGGDAKKTTPRPIRDGETHAEVTLDLGEYRVTRTWTSNESSYLKVTNAEGATYSSPQKLLDSLVGSLSFDPLGFAQMKPAEQRATLIGTLGLADDLAALEVKRKIVFDERTDANRDLRKVTDAVNMRGPVDFDEDIVEESVSDLAEELLAAHAQRQVQANRRRELEALLEDHAGAKERIADLEIKLEQERERLNEIAQQGKALHAEVAAFVEIDVEAIQEKIDGLEAHNATARRVGEVRQLAAEMAQIEDHVAGLNAQLDELDEEKFALLRSAPLPVEGLAFDDEGVTYYGVPFQQSSSAEQLRISLGMAMALNPELRVIRITDGSLLDEDNMALVEEMAVEHDMQVWIERVGLDDMGVVIEDGEVKA